ncbi:hypothetical protein D3C80_1768170 [compost metagenome]
MFRRVSYRQHAGREAAQAHADKPPFITEIDVHFLHLRIRRIIGCDQPQPDPEPGVDVAEDLQLLQRKRHIGGVGARLRAMQPQAGLQCGVDQARVQTEPLPGCRIRQRNFGQHLALSRQQLLNALE